MLLSALFCIPPASNAEWFEAALFSIKESTSCCPSVPSSALSPSVLLPTASSIWPVVTGAVRDLTTSLYGLLPGTMLRGLVMWCASLPGLLWSPSLLRARPPVGPLCTPHAWQLQSHPFIHLLSRFFVLFCFVFCGMKNKL